ncbi:hypothetical protein [Sphingomonas koreensis]|nr:hypothetical protein [Sphingomonas koreensis]
MDLIALPGEQQLQTTPQRIVAFDQEETWRVRTPGDCIHTTSRLQLHV